MGFAYVVVILHEASCLRGESDTSALAFRRLRDRLTRGLRAAQAAPSRDCVQGAESVTTETQRQGVRGRCHGPSVARNTLHHTTFDTVLDRRGSSACGGSAAACVTTTPVLVILERSTITDSRS